MTPGDWIAIAAIIVTVMGMGGGTAIGIFRYLARIEIRLAVIELRLDGVDKEAAQSQSSMVRVLQKRRGY